MLRVLIVDDEALAADRLGRLCARFNEVEVVGTAPDGKSALSLIGDLAPDVLLLDISMPGMDGIALAKALAALEQRPSIIFVTAHSHFAVTAFELAATDYLLKPVSRHRLEQAFSRVAAAAPGSASSSTHLTEFWAPHGHTIVRLGVETLDLLEAERDYVRLHARGQVYLVRATLRDLEHRLDPRCFVRVHRSAIIPVDRVTKLHRGSTGGWTVQLSTGDSVRVGRSFRSLIRKMTTGMDQTWADRTR